MKNRPDLPSLPKEWIKREIRIFAWISDVLLRSFQSKKDQEINTMSSSQASIDSCIKTTKGNCSRIALKRLEQALCSKQKKSRPSNISFQKGSLSCLTPGRQHNLQFLTKALFVLHIKPHCFGAMGIPLTLNCNSS